MQLVICVYNVKELIDIYFTWPAYAGTERLLELEENRATVRDSFRQMRVRNSPTQLV